MHLPILLLAVFISLPDGTFECATNGLCGYQPGCGAYQPQPQPSCGCARSYGCGSYGCYRLRARGAKSYQPKRGRSRVTVASSEEDREVLKQRMAMERVRRKERLTESEELDLVSPSVSRNRHSEEPINPDRAFYECCIDRKLPDACLSKCSFGAFTKSSLQAMYFKQDPCPLDAMKEMQFCAAQGRDHRACCARNGVTTTLAGPKCLSFCDQRLGHPQQLDMSYVPCFDRFESMKSCFWHDMTRYYRRV
uniref:DB domain-containing protein n=1 Tax=Caenorhabditis tropicalis TaxID=1561998 RepID=A0A1I7V2T9_9PELO